MIDPPLYGDTEWLQRLRDQLNDRARRQQGRHELRGALRAARDAGLVQRHDRKLQRNRTEGEPVGTFKVSRKPLDDAPGTGNRNRDTRVPICRYLEPDGNRCTAECLDPDADVVLCLKHLAVAHLEWVRVTAEPAEATK